VAEAAIRSIRIATTLISRYRVLASSQPASSAEFELLIGEAQQIYPEIWRHLDDARKALLADGRDISGFDGYRRSELVELGVTDVDVHQSVDYLSLAMGRYRQTTTKTATFNIGGAQRAFAGARALMAAMPEVDWAGLARAEDQQIAEFGSLQAAKWLGIVKWAALVAGLIALCVVIHRFMS
jgi:precorrin-6B methylase 1